MSDCVLHSWKEIARYLGCGVRTVQRWEHDLGMPVRRPRGEIRSAVIALTSELDDWLARTPVRPAADGDSLLQATLPVIAIIDDNEIHRYTLAVELARAGFSVVEADSGAAAMRLVRAVRPNVAMVDVNMPDMDGFELCRQIKRDSVLHGTAVVIHSSVVDLSEARERGQHAGASAVFSYPVEPGELVQSIRRFLHCTATSVAV